MKKTFGLICFLLLLCSPLSPQAPNTKQSPLALTHVTVIDTTGEPEQPDVTVVGNEYREVIFVIPKDIHIP